MTRLFSLSLYGIVHVQSGDLVDEQKLWPTEADAVRELRDYFDGADERFAVVPVAVQYTLPDASLVTPRPRSR